MDCGVDVYHRVPTSRVLAGSTCHYYLALLPRSVVFRYSLGLHVRLVHWGNTSSSSFL
jgi:hypothetical protein